MKSFVNIAVFIILLFVSTKQYGQHHSQMSVEVDIAKHTMNVIQDLTYNNQTNDTISTIVLNDWNNAYADKNTLLGRRFSDEYVRTFQLSKASDRGSTNNLTIIDQNSLFLDWHRPEKNIDLIEVHLRNKILPNQKVKLHLTYIVRVPSEVYTSYGHNETGALNLKNWYLTPARFEDHQFVRYSNANLDDIANGISDYDLELKLPAQYDATSDLNEIKKTSISVNTAYIFSGKDRLDFSLFIEPKTNFYSYKNDLVEVVTNIKDNKLGDIQSAMVIDRIVNFVGTEIGTFPHQKITVSNVDYERNPFYGLNQLPSWISPFSDEFIFELKFLKTYTNNYLKTSLNLDERKDNWIFDGIQVYVMMKYIDEHHPDAKMMGSLSKIKLLKSYNFINLDFNEQYSYYYMLMARKNLDQPLSETKGNLIRFNEKIASKYRAGLSFIYLDHYLNSATVPNTIKQFYKINTKEQTSRTTFEELLKVNAHKNIDWFFNTIIDSRDLIDYKFSDYSKTKDSITFTIKNKTGTTVPIPVFGLKKGKVVFKTWFEDIKTDSTFTVARKDADKIVINYKNEVPEYNSRNNWKSLKSIYPNNRPIKFVFLKDLEDPYYNQVLYLPTLVYDLYDGLAPGLDFHNKTILDKPFTFDVNPIYSPNTKTLVGNFGFGVNKNYREGRLYYTRYALNGSYFHYAPDAAYLKIDPSVQIFFRPEDLRDNRKQAIVLKYNVINKEPSRLTTANSIQNYAIFNAKYFNRKTEVTSHVNFISDLQFSSGFGKVAQELQYRKLFDSNRQINLRLYAGAFLYKKVDSDTYNFGLYKPNDYLFEYNYFGRSETSGLFSQQYIPAEGGFKSKLFSASANQWMVTANSSFNVWNWIEIYADFGLVKNKYADANFVYDNGIRLNLVTDYLELYFPVNSNNGWEISQSHYQQKIRFIASFSPQTLINLFARKWF